MKLVTFYALERGRKSNDFNPHEREARDFEGYASTFGNIDILIHTSVKLVTEEEEAEKNAAAF